jgi:phosphate ABC transporter phosphate-binding protein
MLTKRTWGFSRAAALLAIALSATAGSRAIAAQGLSQVRKLYVDSLGDDEKSVEMRARLVDRLRRDRSLEIVPDAERANAVVRGTGRVWVAGHFYPNPRSKSFRQDSYSGFLSVEIVGKRGEVFWSYLVTPGRFSQNVAHSLADEAATRLVEALKQVEQRGLSSTASSPPTAGSLTGAGATFPAPLYQLWIETFEKTQSQTHITYDAVGSEAGIERLGEGEVDFAASDMPLPDARLAAIHRRVLQVPSVLGAVVPIYNIENLDRDLDFTPDVLASIYLGEISKWNDPRITASNRGASLPNADIVVVHRSDGSGTSFVWTDYLSKVSPQWKASVGSGLAVQWPLGTGAEHSEGVAAMVQKTPGSIGYVELIYAIQHQLSYGAVRNRAGRFIKADLASVSAAAMNLPAGPRGDLRISITDSDGKDAYPIASFTWLLLPEEMKDAGQRTTLLALVHWFLTSGQRQCSLLGYAPLPSEVAKRALEVIDRRDAVSGMAGGVSRGNSGP